jgi:hypothetical protein
LYKNSQKEENAGKQRVDALLAGVPYFAMSVDATTVG